MCACVCVCACVFVCMCVYVCVCVPLFNVSFTLSVSMATCDRKGGGGIIPDIILSMFKLLSQTFSFPLQSKFHPSVSMATWIGRVVGM